MSKKTVVESKRLQPQTPVECFNDFITHLHELYSDEHATLYVKLRKEEATFFLSRNTEQVRSEVLLREVE